MPSFYQLKSRFQTSLRPIVRVLAAHGVTANQVTIAAVVLSFVAGGLIAWQPDARWPLLLAPFVLLVRMALNAIDGMLAREHGQQSKLGAVLNELGDVVADAVLYLPLALVSGISGPLIVGVVVLATIGEMAGVVAIQIGASRQYQGPMGKSDRAFWLGSLSFILGMGAAPGDWIDWLLGIMLVLSVVTIFNRAKSALKEGG